MKMERKVWLGVFGVFAIAILIFSVYQIYSISQLKDKISGINVKLNSNDVILESLGNEVDSLRESSSSEISNLQEQFLYFP